MRGKIVEIIEDWGWWFSVGERYIVDKYQYKAQKTGTVASCHCWDCVSERLGKELFYMYVVVVGNKKGSIIPVEACEQVEYLK